MILLQSLKKITRLTELQAHYLVQCIIHEDFISKNISNAGNSYVFITIIYHLAQDELAKSKTTKTHPHSTIKTKRDISEELTYRQSIEFWISCDFSSLIISEFLNEISNCFSEPYLFVNEIGRRKIEDDHPLIHEKFLTDDKLNEQAEP